jgi:Rrf2 family transcriptional regulator, nitric oxide-sensitive transcriptional repressor
VKQAGRPNTILDVHIQYADSLSPAILDVNILFLLEHAMFTQTVEYALRALVALAADPGKPQSNRQLAKVTKVPGPYLSKVLQLLTKEGLVEAHRGVRGGFCLSRPARQITILDAVNAVEPIQRIQVCPLGLKAHGKRLCPLHKKMDAALAQVEQAFASTTLADVLSDPSPSVPLCPFPQVVRA